MGHWCAPPSPMQYAKILNRGAMEPMDELAFQAKVLPTQVELSPWNSA
jgi:hypothetical protein